MTPAEAPRGGQGGAGAVVTTGADAPVGGGEGTLNGGSLEGIDGTRGPGKGLT